METNPVCIVKLGVYYLDYIDLTNFKRTTIQIYSVISIDLFAFNKISIDPDLINCINREIQIELIFIKH